MSAAMPLFERSYNDTPQRTDPTPLDFAAIKSTVAEATQLGAEFRLSGAQVDIDGLARLPEALSDRLLACHHWLYGYLGGGRDDGPAIALCRQLGVTPVLVETVADVRDAIRTLERDERANGGYVGLDIETAPKAGQGTPRPAVAINKDGAVAERQPEHKDRTALDPHRAEIACLQIHAGGDTCYVFRSEAPQLVLRSHWLRRQRLAIHNASFEARFLARIGYRPPPGRRSTGKVAGTGGIALDVMVLLVRPVIEQSATLPAAHRWQLAPG
jgi:hypothetical protein